MLPAKRMVAPNSPRARVQARIAPLKMPRNPMLRRILNSHEDLTVLQVSTDAFDIPGAIVADGNASSDYTRFYPSPDGLESLESTLVLARYWTSQDPYEYMDRKRKRCAELLVPDKIPSQLIIGAYVSCVKAQTRMLQIGFALPIAVDHDFFFGAGV